MRFMTNGQYAFADNGDEVRIYQDSGGYDEMILGDFSEEIWYPRYGGNVVEVTQDEFEKIVRGMIASHAQRVTEKLEEDLDWENWD